MSTARAALRAALDAVVAHAYDLTAGPTRASVLKMSYYSAA